MQGPLTFQFPDMQPPEVLSHLQDGTMFSIAQIAPTRVLWKYGSFQEQTILLHGSALCLLHFAVEKRTEVLVNALQDFTTIQFTITGNATAFLNGHGLLHLIEKTYTPLYIPKGTHKVWFEPGQHTFLYIVFDIHHLDLLKDEHPHLDKLVSRLSNHSPHGILLERLPLDSSLLKLITQLSKLHSNGAALKIELEETILKFLSAYAEGMKLKERTLANSTGEELEEKIRLYVIENLLDRELINPRALEGHFSLSPKTLNRIFVKAFGYPPKYFLLHKRMVWALHALITQTDTVRNIAYRLGYLNSNNFTKVFKRHFGLSPRYATRYYQS